jgi:hypothetical protein
MMLYNKTYNLDKMLGDHLQPVSYEIPLPPSELKGRPLARAADLYIHAPRDRDNSHGEARSGGAPKTSAA